MSERPNQQPETLDDIADRLAAASGPDTAAVIRRCADAWRHDQRELQTAQDDNTSMQRGINAAKRAMDGAQ